MFRKSHAFTLALLAVVTLLACTEDPETVDRASAEESREVAGDYLLADQIFESLYRTMDTEARQEGILNGVRTESPGVPRTDCLTKTFTADPDKFFPATLVLDFGTGCTTDDGHTVAGKLIATFDGLLLGPNTSIQLDYQDLFWDGYQVSGTYRVQNLGENEFGQWTFSSEIVDGQLIYPDGGLLQHSRTRTSVRVAGGETNFFTNGLAGIFDDVWETTGTAEGVNPDGVPYTASTPSALVSPVNCQWVVSGELRLDVPTLSAPAILNYGNGTCDNDAVLTVGEYSWNIDL